MLSRERERQPWPVSRSPVSTQPTDPSLLLPTTFPKSSQAEMNNTFGLPLMARESCRQEGTQRPEAKILKSHWFSGICPEYAEYTGYFLLGRLPESQQDTG